MTKPPSSLVWSTVMWLLIAFVFVLWFCAYTFGSTIPADGVLRDEVSTIELNTYHFPTAGTVYLFWDQSGHVQDWAFASTVRDVPMWDGQQWSLLFKRFGKLHHVRAEMYRESDTFLDQEREDQKFVPACRRKLLRGTPYIPDPFVVVEG